MMAQDFLDEVGRCYWCPISKEMEAVSLRALPVHEANTFAEGWVVQGKVQYRRVHTRIPISHTVLVI